MMSKVHQINVLKLFTKNKNIILNENANGVFVNLSELNKDILDKLLEFIKYVNQQEAHLNIVEDTKVDIENTYFK